jgi:two-component system chemotaxis response regulator CheY
VEVENGELAYDTVRNRDIDLVFLDWNMSTKMTGLDVLKEIRKIEKLKNMPIIMVTSESDKISVIEAMKNGATDFVAKPIVQSVFSEKVLRIIVGLMGT